MFIPDGTSETAVILLEIFFDENPAHDCDHITADTCRDFARWALEKGYQSFSQSLRQTAIIREDERAASDSDG